MAFQMEMYWDNDPVQGDTGRSPSDGTRLCRAGVCSATHLDDLLREHTLISKPQGVINASQMDSRLPPSSATLMMITNLMSPNKNQT